MYIGGIDLLDYAFCNLVALLNDIVTVLGICNADTLKIVIFNRNILLSLDTGYAATIFCINLDVVKMPTQCFRTLQLIISVTESDSCILIKSCTG